MMDVLQYQLRPLAVKQITNSRFLLFLGFRPLCPAFSFADVDTLWLSHDAPSAAAVASWCSN